MFWCWNVILFAVVEAVRDSYAPISDDVLIEFFFYAVSSIINFEFEQHWVGRALFETVFPSLFFINSTACLVFLCWYCACVDSFHRLLSAVDAMQRWSVIGCQPHLVKQLSKQERHRRYGGKVYMVQKHKTCVETYNTHTYTYWMKFRYHIALFDTASTRRARSNLSHRATSAKWRSVQKRYCRRAQRRHNTVIIFISNVEIFKVWLVWLHMELLTGNLVAALIFFSWGLRTVCTRSRVVPDGTCKYIILSSFF